MTGSSSMRPGTSSAPIPTSRSAPDRTRMQPMGSPPDMSVTRVSTSAPARRRTSRNAVRVGFSPTPSMATSESGTAAAAAAQKAAAEGSPGTARARGPSGEPPTTATAPSSWFTGTPNAASARSVWSRVGAFSRTRVVPAACSPASSTALLTCALATGGA